MDTNLVLSADQLALYEKLYRGYFRWVVAFFRRNSFGREESRDLAQDTFLRVYRGMQTYRSESEIGYIHTVAVNVAFNAKRARKAAKRDQPEVSLEEILIETAPDPGSRQTGQRSKSPEEEAIDREEERLQRLWLAEEIGKLSPKLSSALGLRLDGLKYQEIADLLGISLDAVKSRIRDAGLKLIQRGKRSADGGRTSSRQGGADG